MSQNTDIYLSIVIPSYNEEKRIIPTLDKMCDYCERKDNSYEIIVVDDGSTDKTSEVIENFCKSLVKQTIRIIRNTKKHGKGFAVKRGVLSARGKFILFSDADMSTPIEEVEKLISFLNEGYQVAIGSRGLCESRIEIPQSVLRRSLGRLFNKFVRSSIIKDIMDTQCGFKCFTRDAAFAIFPKQEITGFCFDIELLSLAQRAGYKIKEVPVVWRNSLPSKVSLLGDSSRMLGDLMRLYFRSIKFNMSRDQ